MSTDRGLLRVRFGVIVEDDLAGADVGGEGARAGAVPVNEVEEAALALTKLFGFDLSDGNGGVDVGVVGGGTDVGDELAGVQVDAGVHASGRGEVQFARGEMEVEIGAEWELDDDVRAVLTAGRIDREKRFVLTDAEVNRRRALGALEVACLGDADGAGVRGPDLIVAAVQVELDVRVFGKRGFREEPSVLGSVGLGGEAPCGEEDCECEAACGGDNAEVVWHGVLYAAVAGWFRPKGDRMRAYHRRRDGSLYLGMTMSVTTFLPVAEQMDLLEKGAAEIIPVDALRERLAESARTGVPLRIKAGFDPTAPDLHLGHTVLMRKLRHFQQLGHTVIFLIGDSTALIGDPTGRDVTRKPLTREQIRENAETYKEQVFKILDAERTEVRYNSEWLDELGFEGMIGLAAKVTLSQMLDRKHFLERFRAEQDISLHELLYPLAQGYDSVMLRSDVELGGTDQKFNLLMGRELQRKDGQRPQIVLMTPILEGLDGVQKMSKSLGNAIGIQEPAAEMYGKLMSISDELMWRYYELLTDLLMSEIALRQEQVAVGQLHPMDAKKTLSRKIVADFHSKDAALAAEAAWVRQFQLRETADDLEEMTFSAEEVSPHFSRNNMMEITHLRIRMAKLISDLGLAASNSEAQRKLLEGAVRVNDVLHKDLAFESPISLVPLRLRVRVGKRAKIAVIKPPINS